MKQFVKHNFIPVTLTTLGLFGFAFMVYSATITTLNATDLISDSRATINTNFTNLNNDKAEGSAANLTDTTYRLINGTLFYNASSTATDNLSWRFNNGFVSNASSTFVSGFTATASSTVSGLFQTGQAFINGSSTILTLNANSILNNASSTLATLNVNSLLNNASSTLSILNVNQGFYASTTIQNLNANALYITASGTIATFNTNTAVIGTSTIQTLNTNSLFNTASGTISIFNTNIAIIASSTHQRVNMNTCGGDGCGELYSFTIASSSSLFGSRVDLPTKEYAYTVTRISCYVVGGTNKVITMTDGTNNMDSITCLTTKTNDDGAIANNTVTAGELMRFTLGATSGSVDTVSVTVFGIRGQ